MRVLAAGAAAAVLLLAAVVPTAGAAPRPSVVVLGDSYASGEGLPSATGDCGTETVRSWGARVALGIGADLQLVACSGAEVADVTGSGPQERQPQLAAVGGPADVVLLTIGGNDLGFVEIVADCLGFAGLEEPPTEATLRDGGWTALLDAEDRDRGCDVTQGELLERIAAFGAADRFPLPDGSTGSMADVHAAVARAAVTGGGRLLVVGYPSLFAPVADWPARYVQRCHGLRAEDAAVLADVVVALDEQLAASADAADAATPDVTVEYVSVLAPFAGEGEGDDHRLCGGGAPWVNGLTLVEGGVDVARLLAQLGAGPGGLDLAAIGARPGGSFHPSTAGHVGISDVVLARLDG